MDLAKGKGERSFHIFYQMVKGLSPEERKELKISGNCSDYRSIMRGGTHTVDRDDPDADAAHFNNPCVASVEVYVHN